MSDKVTVVNRNVLGPLPAGVNECSSFLYTMGSLLFFLTRRIDRTLEFWRIDVGLEL